MRVVGDKDRSEIELDPVQAYKRGRKLDAMLRNANPPRPRGVIRATHAEMMRMDWERQVALAKRVNQG
jgi:hypothetical protein